MKHLGLVGCAALVSLVGCQSQPGGGGEDGLSPVVQDEGHKAEVMALLAKLDGEWELANPTPEMPEGRSVFSVSSAGSVVREIMVPGTPHEMTNLYHMDGNDVVCTHYCAAGNQPRMVASGVSEVDGHPALAFGFDSISNFVEGQDHYMGQMTLVFEGDDRIRQEWMSLARDGSEGGAMVFEMRRVE